VDSADLELLFTENETNAQRLFGTDGGSEHVKDGINDAVVNGLSDRASRRSGSKVAAHVRATVAPGASFTVRVRLTPVRQADPFAGFDEVVARRRREADAFYAA